MKDELKVFNKAKRKAFKQRALLAGILKTTVYDMQYKMRNWQYYKDKKRLVKGKTYNLVMVDVSGHDWGEFDIVVTATFLLDESRLREGKNMEAVKEVKRWTGWASRVTGKMFDHLVIVEKYSLPLAQILEHGYDQLEVQ